MFTNPFMKKAAENVEEKKYAFPSAIAPKSGVSPIFNSGKSLWANPFA